LIRRFLSLICVVTVIGCNQPVSLNGMWSLNREATVTQASNSKISSLEENQSLKSLYVDAVEKTAILIPKLEVTGNKFKILDLSCRITSLSKKDGATCKDQQTGTEKSVGLIYENDQLILYIVPSMPLVYDRKN
jgi:hypothetical protein